ncbi:MAG: PilZ domain-containing protein [Silicimonas sp.]|nr:PilZ domain-containing protein [Silicimonas sp.]
MTIQNRFNRRHSPNRRKTEVAARLHLDDRVEDIVIVDVSYSGMKIALPEPVETGTAVTLDLSGERIPAIVHWSREGFCGLHLLTRLEGKTLKALETARDDLAPYR